MTSLESECAFGFDQFQRCQGHVSDSVHRGERSLSHDALRQIGRGPHHPSFLLEGPSEKEPLPRKDQTGRSGQEGGYIPHLPDKGRQGPRPHLTWTGGIGIGNCRLVMSMGGCLVSVLSFYFGHSVV